jgi:hypothetical protein
MSARVTFRESDLKRAIKAVRESGLPVAEARITPDGEIRILTGGPPGDGLSDLQRWRQKRGARAA